MSDAPKGLPGELMMWVLIVSELLVFAAGLTAFFAVRLTDPVGFAEAQDHLYRTGAALNTAVLITSGFLAAQALVWRRVGKRARARVSLIAAAAAASLAVSSALSSDFCSATSLAIFSLMAASLSRCSSRALFFFRPNMDSSW